MSQSQKKPSIKRPAIKPTKGKKAEEVVKIANPKNAKSGRRDSKQNTLITLLKRPAGATVEEMAKATGWQNHSVHGVMSGVLKKRLGLAITSDKEKRGRVYRAAGGRA